MYSPKECPAKYFALLKFKLNFSFKILNIETPTAIIAGWVFFVNFNSDSGPFKIIFERENPKVLSTISKVSFVESNSL